MRSATELDKQNGIIGKIATRWRLTMAFLFERVDILRLVVACAMGWSIFIHRPDVLNGFVPWAVRHYPLELISLFALYFALAFRSWWGRITGFVTCFLVLSLMPTFTVS